jgi:hypothetical protein
MRQPALLHDDNHLFRGELICAAATAAEFDDDDDNRYQQRAATLAVVVGSGFIQYRSARSRITDF